MVTLTTRPIPERHWRSYGNDPLPIWFLRITCDRCGKVSMLSDVNTTGRRREMPLRNLIAKLRHDGCGGKVGKVELLTGVASG